MTRRALRIRHYLGTIVTACSLGGLALALVLVYLFRSLEARSGELQQRSGEMAELIDLRSGAERWFEELRGALGDRPRLDELELVRQDLLLRLKRIEKETDPAAATELGIVRENVQLAKDGADITTRDRNPRAIEEDRREVLVLLDPLDSAVRFAFQRAEAPLRTRVELLTAEVGARRDGIGRQAGLVVLAYAVLVMGLWRWVNLRFLRPLQALTRESRRAQGGETGFHLAPDGPHEVQQLTESVATLVTGLLGARDNLEEKVKERTEELERASRAKNEFLANMSHEIRTPMTAILGYAELCLAPDIPEDDRLRYAGIIHANGEHLLSVINDILDVSKIEAGQMTVEPTLCSPHAVVDEVRSLMEIRARAKGLELAVESSGGIPELVRTDPTRLRQILLNLVTNAIKFTEEGRVVLRFRLEDPEGEARILFEVEDTGVGMTAEQLERIFRPFVQADTSTTRKYGGSGLGLTISQTLARLLGGDLTCESEPGRGSTFRVTIDPGPLGGVRLLDGSPFDVAGRARGQARSAAEEEAPRGRVLLAEDVAVNRRLIATLLERAGVAVEDAENGRIALERTLAADGSGEPFDIVFMDMQMPEMDGYEATRRLRAAGYGAPIVALTSHSMAGERQRCLEAGCDEYMTKPVDRLALLQVLGRFLSEREDAAA